MKSSQSELTKIHWPQVRALTVANMKARYRKTFAGFLWVILSPVLTFGVQSLVFKHFLKLDVSHYSLFLLTGLLPWIFIIQSVEMTASQFLHSGSILKSFVLHPLLFLLTQIIDNFINFLAAFFLLLLPCLYLDEASPWSALVLLPFSVLSVFIGVVGLSWFLSILNVFYRDVRFVIGFTFNLLFYLTPIFYPEKFIPSDYRFLLYLNPLYHWVAPFRLIMSPLDLSTAFPVLAASFVTSFLILGLAQIYWVAKRNGFYVLL